MRDCPACLRTLPSKPFVSLSLETDSPRSFCDNECCDNFNNQFRVPKYYAMSHEQIGAKLGISKQAVQQIEARALAKLAKRIEAYI